MEGSSVVEQLAAREAIREAAYRYCRGVDRLDLAVMQSAYWPEATDDHGVFVGNAMEFCEMVVRTHERFLGTMHCIYNHSIELEPGGSHARGEIYNVSYMHRQADGMEVVDTWWGRYLDRYERRGSEWRIIERVCVHEWTRTDRVTARMGIASDRFRQGTSDRATPGRAIGP